MAGYTKDNTPQHKRMAMGEKVTGMKKGGAVPAGKKPMFGKKPAGKKNGGKC